MNQKQNHSNNEQENAFFLKACLYIDQKLTDEERKEYEEDLCADKTMRIKFLTFLIQLKVITDITQSSKHMDRLDSSPNDLTHITIQDLTDYEDSCDDSSIVDITQHIQKIEEENRNKLRMIANKKNKKISKNRNMIIIPKIAAYGSIAAILTLACLLIFNTQTPKTGNIEKPTTNTIKPQFVANITNQHNANYALDYDTDQRLKLVAGKIYLNSGFLEIQLKQGTKIIAQSPAFFNIIDENNIFLTYGKITANVPKEAIGFTIQTKNNNIVDLSTKFGVNVTQGQETQVSVFVGKVSLEEIPTPSQNNNPTYATDLTQGNTASISDTGSIDINHIFKISEATTAYLQDWDDINYLHSVDDNIISLNLPPATLAETKLVNPNNAYFFIESKRTHLTQPLKVNIDKAGKFLIKKKYAATIDPDQTIDSYLLHFEIPEKLTVKHPNDATHATAKGTITFKQEIIALIYDSELLDETDDQLGNPLTQYNTGAMYRGVELNENKFSSGSTDYFTISQDRKTLTIDLKVVKIDQLRIITKSPEMLN